METYSETPLWTNALMWSSSFSMALGQIEQWRIFDRVLIVDEDRQTVIVSQERSSEAVRERVEKIQQEVDYCWNHIHYLSGINIKHEASVAIRIVHRQISLGFDDAVAWLGSSEAAAAHLQETIAELFRNHGAMLQRIDAELTTELESNITPVEPVVDEKLSRTNLHPPTDPQDRQLWDLLYANALLPPKVGRSENAIARDFFKHDDLEATRTISRLRGDVRRSNIADWKTT